MSSWYENIPQREQLLMRLNPAGLAVVHTQPFSEDSGKRWKLYPYLRLLTERTMPVLTGGGKLAAFAPPRHGKSMFCSVYVPSWFMLTNPTKNVMVVSYGEDLAAGFSVQARKVVEDLGSYFGVRVNPKQSSARHWSVQWLDEGGGWRDGGSVFAAGADGALPGRGAHLMCLDDVVRGHRDTSKHAMEKAYSWYRSVCETRLEPGSATLLVMTRWSQADLAGRLLEDEPHLWDVLRLPALSEGPGDPLGRPEGAPLCSERYPAEALIAKRDGVGEESGVHFRALYQQSPADREGEIFKSEHVRRWSDAGSGRLRLGETIITRASVGAVFAVCDPALRSGESNDPTGLLVCGVSRCGNLVVLEDRTRRMNGTTDLIPELRRLRAQYGNVPLIVENTAHGLEVCRALEREGFAVKEVKPDRDKVSRAWSAVPAFEAGKVWLPPGKAGDALADELLAFPAGRHDDRVDCASYAVQAYRDRVRSVHALEAAQAMNEGLRERAERDPVQRRRRDLLGGHWIDPDEHRHDLHPDRKRPPRRARWKDLGRWMR